jgi:hypothetical protein
MEPQVDSISQPSRFGDFLKMFRKKLTLLVKSIAFANINQDIRFWPFVSLNELSGIMLSPLRFAILPEVSRKSLR